MNSDGLYKGDIKYDTFKRHLEKTAVGQRWQDVCERDLGFGQGEIPDDHAFWRLFCTVVHARIEFLADFDEVVPLDDANKQLLEKLQLHCASRGKPIVSVPEDILTVLVLKHGGPFLTQRYVREVMHFDPRIAEAIIDCLSVSE